MAETYKSPIINNRPPQTVDSGYYGDIRFDPDDSQPIYIGLHITNGAATTDTGWTVYKFSYSGSNVTRIQLAYGSWDNRVGLF